MLRQYRERVRARRTRPSPSRPRRRIISALIKAEALLSAGQPARRAGSWTACPPTTIPTARRRACACASRWPSIIRRRPPRGVAAFKGEEYPGINGLLTPRAWLEAIVARAGGDAGKARAALLAARTVAEAGLRQRPDDAATHWR